MNEVIEALGRILPYVIGADVQCFTENGYIDECAEALLDSEVGGFELLCEDESQHGHIWSTN